MSEIERFDGRIEAEDVTLGYTLSLYLSTDNPMMVTVIEYEEESGRLQRIGPKPIEGQHWIYPFIEGEEGFLLHANDGREGIYLVRHGHVYQIGGSIRLEYSIPLKDMRQGISRV